MKKHLFLSSLFLFLNILFFSCSNLLNNNSVYGSVSIVMPGSNGRYTAIDQTELPSSYTIKLTRSDGYVKEITAAAGSITTIEELIPNDYDILLTGNTTYYYFEGKAAVKVLSGKDTNVNIQLVKFRRPLYIKSMAKGTKNGTKDNPFSTFDEAFDFVKDCENVLFYVDGNFSGITFPNLPPKIQKLYLRKAPGAADPYIAASSNTITLNKGLCEITDFHIKNTVLKIEGSAQLAIGGSTRFTSEGPHEGYISLNNNNPIIISSPLTTATVAPIKISAPANGRQVLTAGSSNVNIANESSKFIISDDSGSGKINQYAIGSDGKLIENQPVTLNLSNQKETTSFCVKKGGDLIVDKQPFKGNGYIKQDSKIYCFDVGKTYTIEIFVDDILDRSANITIKAGTENIMEFDMSVLYVSSSGDDSKDGSNPSKAFKTLEKAVAKVGANGSIKVLDDITISTPINAINKNFTIKGNGTNTITAATDFITVGTTIEVTLENINIKGNATLGNKLQGTLILNNATFAPNTTITLNNSYLKMSGSSKADKIFFNSKDGDINITGNLTTAKAGTISVNPSILDTLKGTSIFTGNNDIIKNNYSKFTLDSSLTEKNKYRIGEDGKFYKNESVTLTLNKRKSGTTYTYKVKESGASTYLNGSGSTVTDSSALTDYYFDAGKTYTFDIFDGNKIVCSKDIKITASTPTSTNSFTIDLYSYFVKSSGVDSNNGLSEATAFNTISKAIEALSSIDGGTITVIDNVNLGSVTTLPANLTITGKTSMRTISGSSSTLTCNGLTLDNIQLSGINITVPDTKVLTLKNNIKLGNVTLEGTSTSAISKIDTKGLSANAAYPVAKVIVNNFGNGRVVFSNHEHKEKFTYNYDIFKYAINTNGELGPLTTTDLEYWLKNPDKTGKKTTDTVDVSIQLDSSHSTCGYLATNILKNAKYPLINLANIDTTLTEIASNEFKGCTRLKGMTLPYRIKNIGNDAFNGCSNLVSINLENIECMGASAFRDCSSLTSVELSGKLKYDSTNYGIADNAFQNCTSLNSVTINNNTSFPSKTTWLINGFAFADCTALSSITIPECVNGILAKAFSNSGLTEVTFAGSASWKIVADVKQPINPRSNKSETAKWLKDTTLKLTDKNGGKYCPATSLWVNSNHPSYQ